MRILVVEDEHKVARALKEGLEGEYYEVSVAHTGEEGFYLVTVETFDCRDGDRLILPQALVNLIDNAVKYSPAGGRILVRVSRNGKHDAIVEVTDSGPGINAEHRDRIFQRSSWKANGTGVRHPVSALPLVETNKLRAALPIWSRPQQLGGGGRG